MKVYCPRCGCVMIQAQRMKCNDQMFFCSDSACVTCVTEEQEVQRLRYLLPRLLRKRPDFDPFAPDAQEKIEAWDRLIAWSEAEEARRGRQE